jgi:hypothetical protein
MLRRNPFAFVSPGSALLLMAGGVPALASEVDYRIEAAAQDCFKVLTCLQDEVLGVDSACGKVTLSGTVASRFTSLMVEQIVTSLRGVRSVDNQILVVEGPPDPEDWGLGQSVYGLWPEGGNRTGEGV